MKAVVQEQVAAAGIDAADIVAQPFEYLCRQFSETNI
jgi:hypothetical protein